MYSKLLLDDLLDQDLSICIFLDEDVNEMILYMLNTWEEVVSRMEK
jgi:hypothetical protein